MSGTNESQLHIPEGINFDCTGCGNCCFEWPVPVTRDDFDRISAYAKGESVDTNQLFRVLKVADEKLRVFSHSLEKRDDGLCLFLAEDKRCRLHADHGIDAKPAMCRLFPYTFTKTPSGTYASVSFAATGVLFNSGKALTEQSELLERHLKLFDQLFPSLSLDWSETQLIDGQALSWGDYIELERPLLERLSPADDHLRAERVLFEECERFRKRVGAGIKLDNAAGLETNPKIIDQVLVRNLLLAYFPCDAYKSAACDIDAQAVAREFLEEPRKVMLGYRGGRYSFQDLVGVRLGRLAANAADLLRRFAYLRVFSKLYFGPGFNYFSVVAGLHHLALLTCLLRIRLKLEILYRKQEMLSADELFSRLVEDTRVLERRLTVSVFGQETIAMLEILLLSPQRVARLISLAA